jgi:DNA-binding GntR family transcriptional regulator
LTIGRGDRAEKSIRDHLAIIEALEKGDADLAERLSREHTMALAAYVEAHGDTIFD